MKAKAKPFLLGKKIFSVVFSILVTTFLSNGTYAVEMGTNSTTRNINIQYTVTTGQTPEATEEYCLNNPSAKECKDAGEPGSEKWCEKFPASTYCQTEEPKEGTEEYCLKYPSAESCKDAGEPGGEAWCRKFPGGIKCSDSGEPGSEAWCLTFPGSKECKDAGEPGSEAWCKKFPKSNRCVPADAPNTSGNIGPFDTNSKSTSILLPITVFLGTTFITFFIISKIKKKKGASAKFSLENAKFFKTAPKLSKVFNPVLILSIFVGLGASFPSFFISSFRSIADDEMPIIDADTRFTEGENPFGISLNLSGNNLSGAGNQGEFKTLSFDLEARTQNPTGLTISTSSESLELIGPGNAEIPSIDGPITITDFQTSPSAGIGCSTNREVFYPLSKCLNKETEASSLTQTIYLGIKTTQETAPGNYTLKDANKNPLNVTATTNSVDDLFAFYIVYLYLNTDNSNTDNIGDFNLTELTYTPIGRNFRIPDLSNPSEEYNRKGYTFTGWNTKQDGTGESINAGTIYHANQKETNFYAQWQKNNLTFNLTYYANGGDAASVPAAQTFYGTSANFTIEDTIPTRENYTFQGWGICRSENIETIQNTPFTSCPDESTLGTAEYQPGDSYETTYGDETWLEQYSSLFAIWQENDKYTYSLTYKMNDGTNNAFGEMQKEENTYATSHTFTLGASTPTRVGYTFLGWDEDPLVTTPTYLYQDNAFDPEDITLDNTDPQKVLYAIWKKDNIIYNLNFRSGQPEQEDGWVCNITDLPQNASASTTDDSYTFTFSTPSCEDYTFTNWSIDTDISLDNIEITSTSLTIESEPGLSPITVTLTANWTKKEKIAKVLLLDTNADDIGETYDFVFTHTQESAGDPYEFSPDNGDPIQSTIKEVYNIPSITFVSVDPQIEANEISWKSNPNITAVNFEENFKYFKPESTAWWFYGLTSLTTITNLEHLDTSETAEMGYMFAGCSALTSLTLPAGFGQNAEGMGYMFRFDNNLTTIYVSEDTDWSSTDFSDGMFYNTTSLVGGAGTAYNEGHVNASYAKIDDGLNGNPGYFTDKRHKIHFNSNGGTDATKKDWKSDFTEEISYTFNFSTLENPEDYIPTKPGSVFLGWSETENPTIDNNDITFDCEDIVDIESQKLTDTCTVTNFNSTAIDYAYDPEAGTFSGNYESTTFDSTKNLYAVWGGAYNYILHFGYGKGLGELVGPKNSSESPHSFDLSDFDASELLDYFGTSFAGLQSYSENPACPTSQIFYENGSFTPNTITLNSDCQFLDFYAFSKTPKVLLLDTNADNTGETLNFIYDGHTYATNETYGSNTIKAVFNVPDSTYAEGYRKPDWYESYRDQITTVNFEEGFKDFQPDSAYSWFMQMTNLTEVKNLKNLDASQVTTMENMFYQTPNLTSLDFSMAKGFGENAENMIFMFNGDSALESLIFPKDFGSSVLYTVNMFAGCSALTSLTLPDGFGQNAERMENMFVGNSSLTSLALPAGFGQSATNMNSMFANMTSLETIYVPENTDWSSKSGTNMFSGDTNLIGGAGTTYSGGHIDTSYARVDGLNGQPGYFTYATPKAILYGNGTLEFTFDNETYTTGTNNISQVWLIPNDGDTNYLNSSWHGYNELNGSDQYVTNINKVTFKSNFYTFHPKTTRSWFRMISSLEGADAFENLRYLNTSYVEDMSWMFNDLENLTSLTLPDGFGQNATGMSTMFYKDTNLTSLTLPEGFGQNATSIDFMFSNDSALTSLTLPDGFGQNATNMSCVFQDTSSLTSLTLPDGFGQNATRMMNLFARNSALTSLTLPAGFGQNATDMNGMFAGPSALTSLTLPEGFGQNAEEISAMFFNASNLQTIYASPKTNLTNLASVNVFFNAASLVGGAGTTYDGSHVNAPYAKIDGGPEDPGYFTDVCEKDNSCAASPLGVTTTSSSLNLTLVISAIAVAYLGASNATAALLVPKLSRRIS